MRPIRRSAFGQGSFARVELLSSGDYGRYALGAVVLCFLEAMVQVMSARAHVLRKLFGIVTLCLSGISSRAKLGFGSFAMLRTTSLALRIARPRMHRGLRADARVYPVLGTYTIAKIRIPRLKNKDKAWDAQHAWAAERARRLVSDFGGFYTKLAQITGTCSHLMPPEWVRAMAETMDNNKAVPFKKIESILDKDFGPNYIEREFQAFDQIPAATASVAQVHKAVMRDGTVVAVKVNLGRKKLIMSDVRSMKAQSIRAKRMGLDAGLDMPTIMQAYEKVVPEEFDFEKEAEKIIRCQEILKRNGLEKDIVLPSILKASKNCIVMSWIEGPKFSELFVDTDTDVNAFFRQANTTPYRVFTALHRAYGAMLFDPLGHHEFHCDCHPGNLILAPDGRVALLDFGQTKQLSPRLTRGCALACLAMACGDMYKLTKAITDLDEFTLVDGSPSIWALVSYTFFDTRWTPLADVNIYDLDRSVLSRGGFERNSADAFPLMRVSILMRGMMARCGLTDLSMIDAWEPYAQRYLHYKSQARYKKPQTIMPMTQLRRARRRFKSAAYSMLPDYLLALFLFGDSTNSDFLATLRKLQREGQAQQLQGRNAAIATAAN